MPARGHMHHELRGPRSARATITPGHDHPEQTEAIGNKTEDAMKPREGRAWPRPTRTLASMNSGEAVEGPVWSQPMQTPASMKSGEVAEGPVWRHPMQTPASTKSGGAVQGPVWSHPMQTPASFKYDEVAEGPVWRHPMQFPASMKSGGAVEGRPARQHVWRHPRNIPASMLSAGSRDGRPEERRLPGSGRRGLPEPANDEQEYWRRRQAEGVAQGTPPIDGIFPAFRRNTLNLSRACLTFIVLVVVVITCYIIATRIIFLAQWSPSALLNSFYGPSRTSATQGTQQPAMWR
ncbi:uncharacterized protein LOC125942724 [Dermacentor silvarum]|uniref:uncharacterized protein LOC125942724 n=1 Tax=Dermacentor silvarum TaxID=543639 RepID=UPI002101C2F5|nr:uncharacterized protein LOC125942724 [Dermacentor silvarum]